MASCYREEGSLLVVCPASMRLVWAEELERWLPYLSPLDVHLGILLSSSSFLYCGHWTWKWTSSPYQMRSEDVHHGDYTYNKSDPRVIMWLWQFLVGRTTWQRTCRCRRWLSYRSICWHACAKACLHVYGASLLWMKHTICGAPLKSSNATRYVFCPSPFFIASTLWFYLTPWPFQTRAVLELAQKVKRVVLLTGTPSLSRYEWCFWFMSFCGLNQHDALFSTFFWWVAFFNAGHLTSSIKSTACGKLIFLTDPYDVYHLYVFL